MKSPILKSVLIAAALWSSTVVAHPAATTPAVAPSVALPPQARDAERVVDAFHDALARGDAAAAAAILDDSAVIYEEGEAEQSKAAYVASHLPADIAFLKGVRETVVDRVGGASSGMAWIATQGRTEGKFRDRPVNRATTETIVLRHDARGWRIVHVHWSSRALSS